MTATAETAAHLAVGEGITDHAQMRALPVGTRIGPNARSVHIKVDATTWENTSDGTFSHEDNFALASYNKVQALPEVESLMTLRQWQWRFLDHIWLSGEQAGTGERPMMEAQEQLGIPDDLFPTAPGMRVKSAHFQSLVPIGTTMQVGKPDALARFAVFHKNQRQQWIRVLGDYTYFNGTPWTILDVPGDPDPWPNAAGTPEEQEQIMLFKARAWRIGWKQKIQHRWCSSYETYVAQVGLTPSVLTDAKHNGVAIGDRVGPEVAGMLPHGSVLRWVSSQHPERFAWFLRDDNVENQARTRLLFGSGESGRNYASTMEVMWIADGDTWQIPMSHQQGEHLPVGTRLEIGGYLYVKARNGRWSYTDAMRGAVPATGEYVITQFEQNQMRLVSIP